MPRVLPLRGGNDLSPSVLFSGNSGFCGGIGNGLSSVRATCRRLVPRGTDKIPDYLHGSSRGRGGVAGQGDRFGQRRDAYHVEINIRSKTILDWIYRVRDTHHSYIDAEKIHSLRYEKTIQEGRYWTDEVMEYDQTANIGKFYSKKDNSRKEMFIPKDVQDQISCGYYYRTLDVKPGTKATIPVNADEKNWDLEVLAHEVREMKIEGMGTFRAIEVEPIIMFEGFFVRRGKVRGWMSMDERRIPVVMKVKIPVLGDVTATISDYDPGRPQNLN